MFRVDPIKVLEGSLISISEAIQMAKWIVEDKTHYVHFAPPCNTFSQARYPRLRTPNQCLKIQIYICVMYML